MGFPSRVSFFNTQILKLNNIIKRLAHAIESSSSNSTINSANQSTSTQTPQTDSKDNSMSKNERLESRSGLPPKVCLL
jgi:hypothetical protein